MIDELAGSQVSGKSGTKNAEYQSPMVDENNSVEDDKNSIEDPEEGDPA